MTWPGRDAKSEPPSRLLPSGLLVRDHLRGRPDLSRLKFTSFRGSKHRTFPDAVEDAERADTEERSARNIERNSPRKRLRHLLQIIENIVGCLGPVDRFLGQQLSK